MSLFQDPFSDLFRLHGDIGRMHRDLTGLFSMVPELHSLSDYGMSAEGGKTKDEEMAAADEKGTGQQLQKKSQGALATTTAPFRPRCDVRDLGDKIAVQAELPGVPKENVKVEVRDGLLTLSGERQKDETREGEGWRLRERSFGSFSRSFRLPETARADSIQARFQDGVLDVTVPVEQAKKPQPISINIE